MGEGLNKPAEISLYKIVKRDASGAIIRQGEDFQKFVHKLKLMSSRQGTEFVSYDEEKGIWKFRVEHFSRFRSLTSHLNLYFAVCKDSCSKIAFSGMTYKVLHHT